MRLGLGISNASTRTPSNNRRRQGEKGWKLHKASSTQAGLGGLGLVTTFGANITTAATRSEPTAAFTLEASTALATGTVSTTTTSTTTTVAKASVSTVGIAARTAFLHRDLLGTDLVRVGSNGGSIASRIHKFDKSTVLKQRGKVSR